MSSRLEVHVSTGMSRDPRRKISCLGGQQKDVLTLLQADQDVEDKPVLYLFNAVISFSAHGQT